MRNYARNTGQLLSDVARLVNERSPEVTGLTRVSKPRPRWRRLPAGGPARQRLADVEVEVQDT